MQLTSGHNLSKPADLNLASWALKSVLDYSQQWQPAHTLQALTSRRTCKTFRYADLPRKHHVPLWWSGINEPVDDIQGRSTEAQAST